MGELWWNFFKRPGLAFYNERNPHSYGMFSVFRKIAFLFFVELLVVLNLGE